MELSAQILEIFGVYAFAARSALVLSLVAMAIYVLLNAGIFALPHMGLLAVGAYTATILSLDAHVSFALAVLGGAMAGMFFGLLLAALLGRLNGIYLAIATLAFSEAISAAVLNIPLTGAAQGRVGIPRSSSDLAIVGSVVLAMALLLAVRRSRLGLSIVAMREDALMARHQGIDVFAYRIGLMALAGLLCGLAGALNVHVTGFVEPGFFNFGLLAHMLATVVVGGMIYVGGALLGTIVMSTLSQLVTVVGEYQGIVNGLIIMTVVAFAPYGLIGVVSDVIRRRHVFDGSSTPNESDASFLGAPAANDETSLKTHDRKYRQSLSAHGGEPVIELTNISMSFGGIHALQGVSLTCSSGELLGVIGPNGSGKTTLLNVISGAYDPTGGSGVLNGRPMKDLFGSPHRMARAGISRTFQTIRLVDDLSVRDNIAIGLHSMDEGVPVPAIPAMSRRDNEVERLLHEHGIAHLADVSAGELSYGLRRRVEIARAVASSPKLLLLDEPTAGMDPQERADVFARIAALLFKGMGIIVVEHDVAMMSQYCDRLVVLDFGLVIASGDPDGVLREEAVISAYVGGQGVSQ
ncbi:MAG: ATP-binding cassette domain-containing protein [Betaproteobacteria bacterium]|jgi:branched-chain amino acid transport system permease protein|nr:ATP-binding cassette domain-containing protein [Betaproteobacteria bacterium]